jgi:hypothetical protein
VILHFLDPIDGDDKTYEVYKSEKGTICVSVFDGIHTADELEALAENELESHISLNLGDWATLLAAVNKEAKP